MYPGYPGINTHGWLLAGSLKAKSCGRYLVPVITMGGAAEAVNSAVPGCADTYGWLHFQFAISDIFDFELVTCSLE